MKNIIRLGVFIAIIGTIWFYVKRKNAPQITPEKVLITAANAHVQDLDPLRVRDYYAVHEAAKVYEGLVEYHYLKRPFELVANLAESMPTVSADQLVYTFKVREGVRFHDNPCFPDGKGRELTAHDFVYTFKRLADPKLQSLNFWLIDNKLKGLNEWRQRNIDAPQVDYTEEIPGVKAIDRYTLQFTLKKPYPQFLYALAMASCYAVAQEAVAYYGADFSNNPVGTGPFMVEEFNPLGTKIVYRKNPTFRDKRFPSQAADEFKHMLVYANKRLPFVDKIITYIHAEEQPRWLKFKKGQLDVVDVSKDNIALEITSENILIEALQQKGIQLFQALEPSTSLIVFNNAHPLFKDNLKLRQAMSMAFDGQKYNELFYKGAAMQAQSLIPPGLAGYQADYINPYQTYDPQKAKQYLADAGYPEGKGLPVITLDVSNSSAARQKGEHFQKCMQAIGIPIKLVENIFPELVKKLQTKATMLHTISWTVAYPDAENFYQLLYGPNQPGGIGANFDNPAFNALYEKATIMPDSPARTVLYKKLNQIAAEHVPVIPLLHHPTIILYQGWVKNYSHADCICGEEQYFDIDLEQKKALLHKL